ncbi:hypothetical protein KC19_8G138400 [Ceratodon purpureus]|uniref:Uncharacterized protein n=1 Tax=Ceratodon purpureus TaxID=3225 RepID=A0A8T0H3U7_CERPU|nr:hypothetical protein KC19_8G138400 [Ceratodon purpureus]
MHSAFLVFYITVCMYHACASSCSNSDMICFEPGHTYPIVKKTSLIENTVRRWVSACGHCTRSGS